MNTAVGFGLLAFASQTFVPYGHCYLWQSNLVWLHVLADGFTAIAYYSIPIMLLYFVRQRQNIPFKRIFILFSAFIITCGTAYVMDIWTLWYPTYWLAGGIKSLTALVAMYTAFELYPILPKALAMPSQDELKVINRTLEQEVTMRKTIGAELTAQRDFNRLIAEVTSECVDLAPEDLDAEIERILRLIGEFTQAEFSYVFKFSDDYTSMSMTHEWYASEHSSQRAKAQNLSWDDFPWSNQKYMDRDMLYVPHIDDLPPEAAIDQANWRPFNLVSLLAMPLIQNTILTGFIGFGSFSRKIVWDTDAIRTLKTVSRTVANVQERIQTDQKLRASEARFRQFVESMQEIFFIRDFPSLKLQYASPVIETITGLDLDDLYADPLLMFKHIHADDYDRIQKAIQTVEQTNINPLELEFRFNHPDGHIRWFHWKIVALTAEDGKIDRLIGLGSDITKDKQAEQARIQNQKLQLELHLLENILETVLAGYWDWDIPGNYEYLSPGFKRMFGYEADELPNSPETWQTLIAPEDLPKALACLEDHMRTKGQIPYYNEVRYRHKNGSTVWVLCSGEVIEWSTNGEPLRMIGCHIDITKLKTEKELQQKALIFENSSDGIIMTDLNGRITDWNGASETMFGYTKEEVLGRSPSILHLLNDAQTLTRQIVARVQQEGKWQGEVNFVRKDGTEGTCETIVAPLNDQVGNIIATLSVNRDITARKAKEAEIQASLTEKEVMLQEIHHRVKNNLQIVSSLLNLQARRTQFQHLTNILTESQSRVRSMALLHEKLYCSSNLSQIDFGDYVIDLTRTLLRTYRNHEVAINLNLDIEQIYLTLDIAMPCGLIINELVSNALKYAFIGKTEGVVAIQMVAEQQEHRLTIRDNGVGVSPDVDINQGNSLGFQMVHTLVRQLSGTIEIQECGGTLILIQFPNSIS
ncbi:MAG: PAS domain S-box protein [Cyanobacteria bacterium P01_F01_bin.150]